MRKNNETFTKSSALLKMKKGELKYLLEAKLILKHGSVPERARLQLNNNIIIINEIFIQDVHFSVTYIAINMYPVINIKLK